MIEILKTVICIILMIPTSILLYKIYYSLFEKLSNLDNEFFKQKNNFQNAETNNTYNSQNEQKKEINTEKKKEETLPECLQILGFTKYPSNFDEIKIRYKKLIKIYHPDDGGTEEEFQRINNAYEESKTLYKYK